jgi:hypothetical protein
LVGVGRITFLINHDLPQLSLGHFLLSGLVAEEAGAAIAASTCLAEEAASLLFLLTHLILVL